MKFDITYIQKVFI